MDGGAPRRQDRHLRLRRRHALECRSGRVARCQQCDSMLATDSVLAKAELPEAPSSSRRRRRRRWEV